MKKENDHVFFAEDPIVNIGEEEVNFLKGRVMQTKRKTIRLCLHNSPL